MFSLSTSSLVRAGRCCFFLRVKAEVEKMQTRTQRSDAGTKAGIGKMWSLIVCYSQRFMFRIAQKFNQRKHQVKGCFFGIQIVDPKQMERGPIQSRPDYQQTTRTIVSMNKEAGQIQESKRRHIYREDLDPGKLDWLIWLSHNWKWYFAENRISGINSTQSLRQEPAEVLASGNREAFTNDDRWKATWWTTSWWEKSRWKWNDDVWGFFVSGFRTHVVATAVCATECVHTLRVARTFF